MADPIEEEIQREIKANKILIYGKGTKAMPMCGFTRETMHFLRNTDIPTNSSMCCLSRPSAKP